MSKHRSSRTLDLKPAPPDPKIAALYGPLDLKKPGSFEWIVQLTRKAQGIWVSLERSTKDWTDAVSQLDGQMVWDKFPPEKPYGTRDAFYRAELGAPEPELTRAKQDQQLAKNGGDRKSVAFKDARQLIENQSRNTRLKPLGASDTAARVRARLKRDGRTDLVAKIDRGELSSHAAAIEAGFRQRMIQIVPTVEAITRVALKHLSPGDLQRLMDALREAAAGFIA
jgi:hypothetical protein